MTANAGGALAHVLDRVPMPALVEGKRRALLATLAESRDVGVVILDEIAALLCEAIECERDRAEAMTDACHAVSALIAALAEEMRGSAVADEAAPATEHVGRQGPHAALEVLRTCDTATGHSPVLAELRRGVTALRETYQEKCALDEAARIAAGEQVKRFAERVDTLQGLVAEANSRLEAVERAAREDVLTELPNRRHMQSRLFAEAARVGRDRKPLSLLFCDIDGFKAVNDACGHVVGDMVIRQVAKTLAGSLRPGDLVCRWGGEEFVVLLPGTDAAEAQLAAERLREAVAGTRVQGQPAVTISVGAASLSFGDDGHDSADSLVKRADQALYAAKYAGRNRVVAGKALEARRSACGG